MRPGLSVSEEAGGTLGVRLGALLGTELQDPAVRIERLVRLSGGASCETWSFDAVRGDGTCDPLVLRRELPGTGRLSVMSAEAAAIVAAAGAGVPEPRLIFHDATGTGLDAPFMLMERVEGETIGRRVLRNPALAPARERLAYECGQVLARIHRIDPSQIPGIAHPDRVEECADALRDLGEPYPVLELGLRWLLRHPAPGRRAPTIVHGDFRNGNLVIGSDGIRAVLDWELVHIGDPAEDLGWLCVKAWRYGAAPRVGGFGPYEQLAAGYADAGGAEIDPEAVRWWETLGTLRWGLGCISQARRHLDGHVRSVELAAIGRRSCEQEWDLLQLIQ